MFDHILIPTDLSDRAWRPIEMTKQIVDDRHARVTLLHVVEEIAGATREEFDDFYQDLERRSASKLRELARTLERPGLRVERVIVFGRPSVEIPTFARERDVDLVILASHAVDPAQPGRGWGTLSYKITVLAPCPVLLVK